MSKKRKLKQKYLSLFRFISFLSKYKKKFLFMGLSSLLVSCINIPLPWLNKVLIDDIMIKQQTSLLSVVLGGILLTTIIGRSLSALAQYYSAYSQEIMSYDLRTSFLKHLFRLPFSFYDKNQVAKVLSRFEDAAQARNILVEGTITVMISIPYLVIIPIIVFSMNVKLTLLAGLTVPWMISSLVGLSRFTREYSRKHAEIKAENDARLYEGLSGLREIKALGILPSVYRRINLLFLKRRKFRMYLDSCTIIEEWLSEVLQAIGSFCYMWFGVSAVANGDLSVGEFMAFSSFVGYMYDALEKIYMLIIPIQKANVFTKRYYEVKDLKKEVEVPKNVVDFESLKGDIELRDIQFSYNEERRILDGLSLDIKDNQTVAIIGKTGSGKSTLVNLLPHFYGIQSGEIKISGIDIKRVDLDKLRSQFSIVSQFPFIFSGTIEENITGGLKGYASYQVEDAAKKACLHDFVSSLSEGYETVIGENGVTLSGGERQRVAIARAFLLDRPFLILDEATSNLDVNTENEIQKNIDEFCKGRTVVIIAHRLSTISKADKIVVLNKGKIVEEGTPVELLERKGFYYDFYNKSFNK